MDPVQKTDPVLAALAIAPVDEEPLTLEERAARDESRADRARGERGVSTAELRRRLTE